MNILWNSSTPIGCSGYGRVTAQIVQRLVQAGHFVRIATKHPYFGWHDWQGVEIFDGSVPKRLKAMLSDPDDVQFDYIFTYWDVWVLNNSVDKFRYPRDKWAAWIPIDTEKIGRQLAEIARDIGVPIASSKHGRRELGESGCEDVLYAPHGVDTKTFKPDSEGRRLFRESFGWDDDTFVIGTVGLNYPDDRKGLITLFQAFKTFHERHPKARLYVHAHAPGEDQGTINYIDVIKNLDIAEYVAWPPMLAYDLRRIDDEWLCEVYNGFDVFCSPNKGEGFGLCLTESMACGVPIIVTDQTTGPELAGDTGWLIKTHEDSARWLNTGTWRRECWPSEILASLEDAYAVWKDDKARWLEIKVNARKFALKYDWDVVWDKYLVPILKVMEERLETKTAEENK